MNVSEEGCSSYSTCRDINPCNAARPERSGDWCRNTLRDFKGSWTKKFERFSTQSGNHEAEDLVAEFMNFTQGDCVVLYAFLLFGQNDGMTALLGKVCPSDAQCDTGVLGEAHNNGSGVTIKNKRKLGVSNSEQRSTEKTIVLKIMDESMKNSDSGEREREKERAEREREQRATEQREREQRDREREIERASSSIEAIEKDNISYAKMILELSASTEDMKAEALQMLVRMQKTKRERLEKLTGSFSTPH